MELSFREKLCWQEVVDCNLENKLRVLEDSKSYLQLSKLGEDTFEHLLLYFLERYGSTYDKTLNHAMENYFNRKKIKPLVFLQKPNLVSLQTIWLNYHHVPLSELTPKSTPSISGPMVSSNIYGTSPSFPS
jgi:hypothetical protein